MKTSEAINELATALALARLEIETVPMSGLNPHFKSKYSKLSDFYTATNKPLSKYGISLIQSPCMQDGKVVIITRLIHKSGQWIETTGLALKALNDTPQAIGSAVSYGRRYDVAAILGLASEEDDDGEAAHGRGGENNAELSKLRNDLAAAHKEIATLKAKIPQVFDSKDDKHVTKLSKKLKEANLQIQDNEFALLLDRLHGKPLNEIANLLKEELGI